MSRNRKTIEKAETHVANLSAGMRLASRDRLPLRWPDEASKVFLSRRWSLCHLLFVCPFLCNNLTLGPLTEEMSALVEPLAAAAYI
jgi:hypothetical protein